MESFDNRTAIITGGGSGIGRAMALTLARAGANTVLVGTTASRLEQVRTEIEAFGARCETITSDVREPAVFENARDVALASFGRIDLIVNNAGAISSGFPEDVPLEEWQRAFDVNVMALVRSNAVFLPILLQQKCGHIVNVVSVDGLYGFGYDRLHYAASKGAAMILSEGLVLYLKPQGIGLTCFCPGPVATNIGDSMKVFGRPVDIHGPGEGFDMITADAAADLILEGVRNNAFLVLGHPPTAEILHRRGADMNAFVDHQIAHPQILFPAGSLPPTNLPDTAAPVED